MDQVNTGTRMGITFGRRGSAAVESAVLLPLLTLLALGATDFARFSFAYISVATAARNGAAYGSRSISNALDKAGIATAACDEMSSVRGSTNSNPSVISKRIREGDADSNDAADYLGPDDSYIRVTTQFQFDTILRYPGLASTVTISRTVRMRVMP